MCVQTFPQTRTTAANAVTTALQGLIAYQDLAAVQMEPLIVATSVQTFPQICKTAVSAATAVPMVEVAPLASAPVHKIKSSALAAAAESVQTLRTTCTIAVLVGHRAVREEPA